MASLPIYIYYSNQSLLNPEPDDGNRNSPTRGGRTISRWASTRRITSFRNTLNNRRGGSVRRGESESSGEQQAADNACMKRCQMAPGYVSLEDVIGGEASFGREGRGARRLPEVDGIRDPLVRAALRLYAGDTAHQPPRHRRRTPSPLGTCRGSFLHWLFKKDVSPCLGFLASAFLCGSAG